MDDKKLKVADAVREGDKLEEVGFRLQLNGIHNLHKDSHLYHHLYLFNNNKKNIIQLHT